jgi:ABC-type nitrate/sulfonate/bicarbonate transport system substrate-binding protein
MNTSITQSSVTQSSINIKSAKQTISGAACSLSKRNSRAIYLLAGLAISVTASMPSTVFATQLATDNQPAQVLMDEQARLEAKADASRDLSNKTELEQLEKARQASQENEQRAQDLLSKQDKRDWQAEQQGKAEQGFEQRQSREQRYLEEAQKAAGQEKRLIIKQHTTATEEK